MKLTIEHIKETFPGLAHIPDSGLLLEPRHMALAFTPLNGGNYHYAWDIAAVMCDIMSEDLYSTTQVRLQAYRATIEQFLLFADRNPGAYIRTVVASARATARGPAAFRRALVRTANQRNMTIPDTLTSEHVDRLAITARVKLTEPEFKHLVALATAQGFTHKNGEPNVSAFMRFRLLDEEK